MYDIYLTCLEHQDIFLSSDEIGTIFPDDKPSAFRHNQLVLMTWLDVINCYHPYGPGPDLNLRRSITGGR